MPNRICRFYRRRCRTSAGGRVVVDRVRVERVEPGAAGLGKQGPSALGNDRSAQVVDDAVTLELRLPGLVVFDISGNPPHCVIAGERSGERVRQIGRGDETGEIVITRARLTNADQIAVGVVAIQLGLGAALLRLRVRREGDPRPAASVAQLP